MEPDPRAIAQAAPAETASKNARPVFWAKRLTGYLPARDGVRLHYSVILPEGKGPFPVVMDYSVYSPSGIGGSAYLKRSSMSGGLDRALVERGYAVMGVNARGTACSEGTIDLSGRAYGTDGADSVEWAARQPWSTAAIGMAKYSYAGMSQLWTAAERPPHLKAIAPGMVVTDSRLDAWNLGGVPSHGFLRNWWDYMVSQWRSVRHSAVADGDKECAAREALNEKVGQDPNNFLPTLVLRHPLRDAWLHEHSVIERVHQIDVPVLSVEAFQDEATTARAGYYQDRIPQDKLWLLQMNGMHASYDSLALQGTLLDFFDHFLKGANNGFDKKPRVEIWMEAKSKDSAVFRLRDTAPSWTITRPAFPVTVDHYTLSLGAGGELVPAGNKYGSPDKYSYPVPGAEIRSAARGGLEWGELRSGWRDGSLAYTSPALEKELVAYGSASADLWISSDANDTDLQVTLTEVLPDGREVYVQRGWLRLSSRAIDEMQSSAVRPILKDTPEAISALVSGVPVLGRVELTKFAYLFRKNSKIRLWIEAPNGKRFSHHAWPATNQLWHDAEHPSKLVMGILKDYGTPPQVEPCAAIGQPCRADPLQPRPR